MNPHGHHRPAPADELLTITEAAQRLRLSVRHVRRLLAERRIAYHRLGRSIRLHPADLDTYVAAGRVESDDGSGDEQ
jgi:excisionase family DNA binding protein